MDVFAGGAIEAVLVVRIAQEEIDGREWNEKPHHTRRTPMKTIRVAATERALSGWQRWLRDAAQIGDDLWFHWLFSSFYERTEAPDNLPTALIEFPDGAVVTVEDAQGLWWD